MTLILLLAALGLLFDIIGASILFRFRIPPKEVMDTFWESPGDEPKKTYKNTSQCGFILLVAGFFLQFISTLATMICRLA